MKLSETKMTQRKFVIPSVAMLLAIINDAAGMGFDFKTMVLICATSVLYAFAQTWYDISVRKYPLINAIIADATKKAKAEEEK